MSFQPNKTWFTFRKEVYLLAFVLSIILLMLTTVLLSRSAVAITAEPLASPTYVYYPANVDGVTHKGRIEATGGHFGNGTTTFNLVSDGDNRYQAYFKTTAESSKDLIGQDTLTFTQCYVNAQITLNNDGTGSIKTPANLNDSSSNSEMCGYSIASQLSDLNQSSIIIATADTAMPTKDDQVFVNVHVSFSTEQQGGTFGPISLQIKDVTNNSKKYNSIDTDSFKLSDSSDAVLKATFSGVDAGAYKVCIASDDSICSSSFTKVDATASTVTIELTEDQAKAFIIVDSSTTCAISGVGWIICPMMTFLSDITDGAFGILENFLQIDNRTVNDSGTYSAWQAMRNIANVFFVLLFLIMIISQITGFGVTDFGIKKLLPKLVLVALLINVSYFVCQIAVDLSNILGSFLKDVLENIAIKNSGTGTFDAGSVFGVIIAGVGIAGGVTMGVLAISVPVLLSAVLAILVTLLILIGRQAAIVILIVVAPIAFALYALPNTSDIFKKWGKMFAGLLLVYPMIGLVYGASSLAGGILASSAGEDPLLQLVAFGVRAVPLIVTPMLLKGALDATGNIGATLKGFATKRNAAIGGKIKDTSALGAYKSGFDAKQSLKRAQIRSGSYQGGGLAGLASRGYGRFNKTRMGALVGGNRLATQGAKIEEDQLKEAGLALQKELDGIRATGGDTDSFLINRASSGRTIMERRAAMHNLAVNGRDEQLRTLRDDPDFAYQSDLRNAISVNFSSLKDRAPDLVKGEGSAFANVTGDQLSKFSTGTAARYIRHLETLHKTATQVGATPQQKQARDDAVAAFNSAVTDITLSPSLQGAFSGEVGRKIQDVTATTSPGFQGYASTNLIGLAAIQSDGKIR